MNRKKTKTEGAVNHTSEHLLLQQHPGVREMVESLPEFHRWRAGFATVDVDAEKFTVVGGDRLMDDDQLIVEWVRLFRPELIGGR